MIIRFARDLWWRRNSGRTLKDRIGLALYAAWAHGPIDRRSDRLFKFWLKCSAKTVTAQPSSDREGGK